MARTLACAMLTLVPENLWLIHVPEDRLHVKMMGVGFIDNLKFS